MSDAPEDAEAPLADDASVAVQITQQKTSSPLWAILAWFSAIVFVAALGIWLFIPAWYTRLAGTEAQGIAYHFKDCGTDEDGDETFLTTIVFVDVQSQLQESTSGNDCSSSFDDSETTPLWYLPSAPGNAFLGGEEMVGFIIITLLWLGGFLVIAWLFARAAWLFIRTVREKSDLFGLWLPVLLCLLMLAPVLVAAQFFPPPAGQKHNGPARNFHPGEVVSVKGRWEMSVQVSSYQAAGGGNACLELHLTMRNLTSQRVSLQKGQFTLYDRQLKTVEATCPVDTAKLAETTVAPGEVIERATAYKVPASARQFYLAFQADPPGDALFGRFIWSIPTT